jgi:hypothetical protein
MTAGVLTTAGFDARVQPTTAALAARISTRDAFMLGPPSKVGNPPAACTAAILRPNAGWNLAGRRRFFQGSYSGTKDYNERTRKFIASGKALVLAAQFAP